MTQSQITGISIIFPCLNEAETIGECIEEAIKYAVDINCPFEIIVADNGSQDGSKDIVLKHNARLVEVSKRGYGNAIKAGVAEAKYDYVIMLDADMSYSLENLEQFISKLNRGFDLVMGNRFTGKIHKNAMPFLHKYLGNPVLSWIGNKIYKTGIGDFHCGIRAFRKDFFEQLTLISGGMEFASELVIKSCLSYGKVTEVPVELRPDGRSRSPHLRTWRDGWRHLRLLLTYSPYKLFTYPGIVLVAFSLITASLIEFRSISIGSWTLGVHSLILLMAFASIGVQLITFGVVSRFVEYSNMHLKMGNTEKAMKWNNPGKTEKWLISGFLVFFTGLILFFLLIIKWQQNGTYLLDPEIGIRVAAPAFFLIISGAQLMLLALVLTSLEIQIANHEKNLK